MINFVNYHKSLLKSSAVSGQVFLPSVSEELATPHYIQATVEMKIEAKMVPFDGIRREPESPVARKIQLSYRAGQPISHLIFKFDDEKVQFVNPGELEDG